MFTHDLSHFLGAIFSSFSRLVFSRRFCFLFFFMSCNAVPSPFSLSSHLSLLIEKIFFLPREAKTRRKASGRNCWTIEPRRKKERIYAAEPCKQRRLFIIKDQIRFTQMKKEDEKEDRLHPSSARSGRKHNLFSLFFLLEGGSGGRRRCICIDIGRATEKTSFYTLFLGGKQGPP